ncbi:MAG: hypothetical protein ABI045_03405 [Flavobacteriales bacterium]
MENIKSSLKSLPNKKYSCSGLPTYNHDQKGLLIVNQRYKKLKDKGAEFVGISLDTDKKQLSAYVMDIKSYNYCDLKGYMSPLA